MEPTINVLYTCESCGLVDVPVSVKARTTEDVVAWVKEIMGEAVGADHFRRSPHCRVTTLTNVKIPMTGTSKVGGPVEN